MKGYIRFELVRPTEEDARLIMEWRNDPTTRKMSFHSGLKTWPEFLEEFHTFFRFPELPPLFALDEGKRVGFLRLKPCLNPRESGRNCCSIDINIAPDLRGKGIGAAVLKNCIQWVSIQGYDNLYAEVKPENEPSLKAFAKAGFKRLEDGFHLLEEEGVYVPIARFLAQASAHSPKQRVWIIAEAGSNWKAGTPSEDRDRARKMIEAAKEAGVDAIKFQVFRPETVYVPNAGQSNYLSDAGIHEAVTDLFHKFAMPYEMIPDLAELCQKQGIEFMASAFSPEDFKKIDPFVNKHKIASYEIGHIHLLSLAAHSGKTTFLSTGAATEEEIDWAVERFKKEGGQGLSLMQCTAHYPAATASLHLNTIPWMRNRYGVPVGLSDHSRDPSLAPIIATALGASCIEKHFTLDRSLPGPDHAFAITPEELKTCVAAIREAEKAGGDSIKQVDPSEKELRNFACRGVQVIQNIRKGERFVEGLNVAILRPGQQKRGVHPRFLADMEGKAAQRDLWLGEGIQIGDWK